MGREGSKVLNIFPIVLVPNRHGKGGLISISDKVRKYELFFFWMASLSPGGELAFVLFLFPLPWLELSPVLISRQDTRTSAGCTPAIFCQILLGKLCHFVIDTLGWDSSAPCSRRRTDGDWRPAPLRLQVGFTPSSIRNSQTDIFHSKGIFMNKSRVERTGSWGNMFVRLQSTEVI